MVKWINIMWSFSRPHTIIGSVVSIITLYLLATPEMQRFQQLSILWLTLIAGLACNVMIVGINQLVDHELDKINKPYLPLAAGVLRRKTAWLIVLTCLLISIVAGFAASTILGILICIILAIGLAYSLPPIQLKRHHLPAAIAITGVRGILVNVGMFAHFQVSAGEALDWSYEPLWLLTGFVTAFSISIAWFKDLADVEGDKKFQFQTAPVLYSVKTVFITGSSLLILAYLLAVAWAWRAGETHLLAAHVLAMSIFLVMVYRTNTKAKDSVASFYKYFWALFFWEYLCFGAWALL